VASISTNASSFCPRACSTTTWSKPPAVTGAAAGGLPAGAAGEWRSRRRGLAPSSRRPPTLVEIVERLPPTAMVTPLPRAACAGQQQSAPKNDASKWRGRMIASSLPGPPD
jgi:hypothetical protein